MSWNEPPLPTGTTVARYTVVAPTSDGTVVATSSVAGSVRTALVQPQLGPGVQLTIEVRARVDGYLLGAPATIVANMSARPFNHRINSGRIGVGAPDRVLGVSSREVVLPLPTGVLIGAVDTDPVGGMEPRPVHVFSDGDRVLVLVPGGVTIVRLSMLRAPWQQFPTAP